MKTDKNVSGWVLFSGGQYPGAWIYDLIYYRDTWEVLETFKIRGKTWTARRLEFTVGVYTENIRDKPGLIDTKVISQIKDRYSSTICTAITEEEDTIDGITDHWLKINYNGVERWVFGGYVSTDLGGIKYRRPDSIICRYLFPHEM